MSAILLVRLLYAAILIVICSLGPTAMLSLLLDFVVMPLAIGPMAQWIGILGNALAAIVVMFLILAPFLGIGLIMQENPTLLRDTTRCENCGYSLKGLGSYPESGGSTEARCPECGDCLLQSDDAAERLKAINRSYNAIIYSERPRYGKILLLTVSLSLVTFCIVSICQSDDSARADVFLRFPAFLLLPSLTLLPRTMREEKAVRQMRQELIRQTL